MFQSIWLFSSASSGDKSEQRFSLVWKIQDDMLQDVEKLSWEELTEDFREEYVVLERQVNSHTSSNYWQYWKCRNEGIYVEIKLSQY